MAALDLCVSFWTCFVCCSSLLSLFLGRKKKNRGLRKKEKRFSLSIFLSYSFFARPRRPDHRLLLWMFTHPTDEGEAHAFLVSQLQAEGQQFKDAFFLTSQIQNNTKIWSKMAENDVHVVGVDNKSSLTAPEECFPQVKKLRTKQTPNKIPGYIVAVWKKNTKNTNVT